MTETYKQRLEREIKEQMEASRGETSVPVDPDSVKLAQLQEKYDRLLTAYHEMCDRATKAEEKSKHLRLTRKEDGLWLYIHSTTHNTDALILLSEHGHGQLVRKTINGHVEENPS